MDYHIFVYVSSSLYLRCFAWIFEKRTSLLLGSCVMDYRSFTLTRTFEREVSSRTLKLKGHVEHRPRLPDPRQYNDTVRDSLRFCSAVVYTLKPAQKCGHRPLDRRRPRAIICRCGPARRDRTLSHSQIPTNLCTNRSTLPRYFNILLRSFAEYQ